MDRTNISLLNKKRKEITELKIGKKSVQYSKRLKLLLLSSVHAHQHHFFSFSSPFSPFSLSSIFFFVCLSRDDLNNGYSERLALTYFSNVHDFKI